MAESIPLLSLNELSDEPHNAFFKFFASRRKVKQSAFETVKQQGVSSFSRQFWWVVEALLHFWFGSKGDDMDIELTPEKLVELGKMLEGTLIPRLPLEEILAGFKPEEILAEFKPKEILAVIKPEEILAELKPEERLAGLSAKEIEAYLNKIKKNI